jgi:hypothetical protein
LVKKISDPGGKLKSLEIRMVSLEVAPETLKAFSLQTGWENLHDLPGHDFRIKRRFFAHFGDDFSKDAVNKMIGERKLEIGANPMMPGQLHGNPSFHSLALHYDDFALERRGQRIA